MSDGKEEREQREAQREQEKKRDQSDRIDPYRYDEWKPERRDS